MKLWEKNIETRQEVMDFTRGNDAEFDRLLAPYDVVGSMAHAIMLGETGIIQRSESEDLVNELSKIFPEVSKESFRLLPEEEDIHTHLEQLLIRKLGDTGKRIHTARSRNDQVMMALMLFFREEWRNIHCEADALFETLTSLAEKHKDTLLPGYTHTQVAMPSSVGLWLGGYAESLVGDLLFSEGIIRNIDQNPLGSAAGYGTSFPIDRELTTQLAGFRSLQISATSAQLGRGKMEILMAYGISAFAMTLSRLASDSILYMGQNHHFISFPDELTTGSSIMPHKKNPDVLELIRAHCNKMIQLPAILSGISTNLTSGYHRDFQLTKEMIFPAIEQIKKCMGMMRLMMSHIQIREGILNEEKYRYIFTVEEVNSKVIEGKPFRDAYREVADDIREKRYNPGRNHLYTHTGSIGNPAIENIRKKMEEAKRNICIKSIGEVFDELSTYFEKD